MPPIPTKRVRVLATGHVCTINVSDFDPRIHEDAPEPKRAPTPAIAAPAAPTPPEPDTFDETPGSIATVNVDVALSLIDQADSLSALAELEHAEKASLKNKGGRKSVLTAIKDRRAALRKG
jgi:hypothetical protein